jgi:hypothetical protein
MSLITTSETVGQSGQSMKDRPRVNGLYPGGPDEVGAKKKKSLLAGRGAPARLLQMTCIYGVASNYVALCTGYL